jgi:hypothetical protein
LETLRKRSYSRPHPSPGTQWLMLAILATWETEIRRIEISGQPGQKRLGRLHLNRKIPGYGSVYLSYQLLQKT